MKTALVSTFLFSSSLFANPYSQYETQNNYWGGFDIKINYEEVSDRHVNQASYAIETLANYKLISEVTQKSLKEKAQRLFVPSLNSDCESWKLSIIERFQTRRWKLKNFKCNHVYKIEEDWYDRKISVKTPSFSGIAKFEDQDAVDFLRD